VTIPATETSTGVMTYTCGNCSGTNTETIPMLDPVPAGKTTFVKVESAPTDWSGMYLIVHESEDGTFYILNSALGADVDQGSNYVALENFSIVNGKIITDVNNAVTIEPYNGNYAIKIGSDLYISGVSNGNKLNQSTNAAEITLSINTDCSVNIFSGRYLRFNDASGTSNMRFRFYNSTYGKSVFLYKLEESHSHTPGKAVKENEQAPTCTENGFYDSVIYCTDPECGQEISRKTVIVETSGHSVVAVEAKAPTCTEVGHEAYEYCTECDYSTYVEIPAAHTPGKAVVENIVNGSGSKLPTYDAVTYCTACGAEISRVPTTATYTSVAGTMVNLASSLEIQFGFTMNNIPNDGSVVIRREFSKNKDGIIKDDDVIVLQKADINEAYSSKIKLYTYRDIVAAHMSDAFYITVYDGNGNIVSVHKDSMRDYIMRQLVKAEAKNTDLGAKERTFYVDMLNYGAAAQVKFKYGHEDKQNLANALLSDTQKGYATPAAPGENHYTKPANYMGSMIALESTIELQMVFKNTVVTTDMKAVVTYTSVYGGDPISIEISGDQFRNYNNSGWLVAVSMPPAEGKQMVTCTIYDGDTVVATVADSIESYLSRMYDRDTFYPVVLQYINSAMAYFTAKKAAG
jgi:hypothetical protein